jgi:hypothetical protein
MVGQHTMVEKCGGGFFNHFKAAGKQSNITYNSKYM